jgi:hypothetical protein
VITERYATRSCRVAHHSVVHTAAHVLERLRCSDEDGRAAHLLAEVDHSGSQTRARVRLSSSFEGCPAFESRRARQSTFSLTKFAILQNGDCSDPRPPRSRRVDGVHDVLAESPRVGRAGAVIQEGVLAHGHGTRHGTRVVQGVKPDGLLRWLSILITALLANAGPLSRESVDNSCGGEPDAMNPVATCHRTTSRNP